MPRQWIQITSGRGPAECAWAVPRVMRCLLKDAAREKVASEVLETVPAFFPETLYSVLLTLDGPSSSALVKRWSGTIEWIGRSPFRPDYKRKNWFVGVSALALPQRFPWSEKDLKIETLRASGPGGQHVNKTESAVRVKHLPTGLSVLAREERSQQANRKLAFARLAELLAQRENQSVQCVQQQRWNQHNELERGNPIRVYEGTGFKLRS